MHPLIMPEPPDTGGAARPHSEEISHLIDGGIPSLTLLRETLGKLATIALTPLLERDEIGDTDAAVATNTVRGDLASIQQLVQMRAAHSEALGSLRRRQRDRRRFDHGQIHAFADAAAHAEQYVSQLRSGSVLGELRESLELVNRDARSRNGLHHGTHHRCHN